MKEGAPKRVIKIEPELEFEEGVVGSIAPVNHQQKVLKDEEKRKMGVVGAIKPEDDSTLAKFDPRVESLKEDLRILEEGLLAASEHNEDFPEGFWNAVRRFPGINLIARRFGEGGGKKVSELSKKQKKQIVKEIIRIKIELGDEKVPKYRIGQKFKLNKEGIEHYLQINFFTANTRFEIESVDFAYGEPRYTVNYFSVDFEELKKTFYKTESELDKYCEEVK